MDTLAEALNLPFEDWMQDWPYEVTIPVDIERFIVHYAKLTDEDEQFTLMESIIQLTEDQTTEALFIKYWQQIKPILQKDFYIHEYTIYYWACFDDENQVDCWKIAPLMRQLWQENHKLKLLFVCTVNRMRSATAHEIYKNDNRFEVKSAGTDKTANTVLTIDILNWADSIVVMEKYHRSYIRKHFPAIYNTKRIVCLYIPDEYDYMQAALIAILKDKIEDVYTRKLI